MARKPGDHTVNQERTRAAIAEAAAHRLLAGSVERLAAAGAPTAVADACDISPDTVHRLVGDRHAVLEHSFATVIGNLDFHSADWPSFGAVTDRAAETFLTGLAGDGDKTAAFLEALEIFIDTNFSTPARPAGTLIEAALMTTSPRWTGPNFVEDPEQQRFADAMREIRARHLRETTEGIGWLLAEAMALLERRPQRGMTPNTLITLMNCLVDGAVMRMLVDPDALDTSTVAEAVLRLGIAYTEPGSFADPHEPDDATSREIFERIVDLATDTWAGRDDITIDDLAGEDPTIDRATINRWFPSVRELADSVVRRKVGSVQPEPSEHPDALVATLESVLRRLSLTADALPGAVREAFHGDPPPRSIAAQVTEHAHAVAEALGQPDVLATELVADACEGSNRWTRTQNLLRLLDPDTDPAST